MPGGVCKAAICLSASRAIGKEMQTFIDRFLTSEEQTQRVIAAHELHIDTLIHIAEEIEVPPPE